MNIQVLQSFKYLHWLVAYAILMLCSQPSYAQTDLTLPRKVALGAALQPASADDLKAANINATAALKIERVLPLLTADKLGLKTDDILVSVDGKSFATTADLVKYIAEKKPNEALSFKVFRNNKLSQIEGVWIERTREASTATYKVEYGQTQATLGRMRTIVTTPLKTAKHPALLFIQGVTLSSVDFALAGDENNAYARIVRSFAERGYVTMRVDKPGVGDSEGAPAAKVSFVQELDAYRQALRQLISRSDVDPNQVVIFGHSMGGLWGPILASETKIAATIVSGTTFRTWIEYVLENARRQSTLDGATATELDREMKSRSALFHYYFNERMSPTDIAKKDSTLANLVKEDFPDATTWAGRSHQFWYEVNAINLPEIWQKTSGKVLALWGENEFVSSESDHTMLQAWINKLRLGSASYARVAQSDHGFSLTTSPADSLAKWGKPEAKFNPNIIQITHDWLAQALK
jgi:uncharacterized protein